MLSLFSRRSFVFGMSGSCVDFDAQLRKTDWRSRSFCACCGSIFIHHAQSAEGIVNPVSTGSHVRIDFTTASGKKSWFSTSGEVATHPGQRVEVLYREGLHSNWYPDGVDACMASPGSLWYLPSRLSVLGGRFFVVGTWGASIDRMMQALRRSLRKP
jgi:hypothetical protein